jgi:ankyrin repeat protein
LACLGGQLEIVKYLISRGADPNAQVLAYEATPLHIAKQNGFLPIVRFLKGVTSIDNQRRKIRLTAKYS